MCVRLYVQTGILVKCDRFWTESDKSYFSLDGTEMASVLFGGGETAEATWIRWYCWGSLVYVFVGKWRIIYQWKMISNVKYIINALK